MDDTDCEECGGMETWLERAKPDDPGAWRFQESDGFMSTVKRWVTTETCGSCSE